MDLPKFIQLEKEGYNRIPFVREILADLDTPLSCFLKLANQPYSYLFESVQGGEKWGRYSIIGLPCKNTIQVRGNRLTIQEHPPEMPVKILHEEHVDDPLKFIEDYQKQFKVYQPEGLPRFNGGLVGYFGYDTIRYIEPKLAKSCPKDTLAVPDILLMLSDSLVVFDNLAGKLLLLHYVDPRDESAHSRGHQFLDETIAKMRQSLDIEQVVASSARAQEVKEEDFVSGFSRESYKSAVERIKEYTLAGDTMQVALSQRMQLPFAAEPIHLYRALRSLNPSPYMFCLNLNDFHVVGSSPEILVHMEDGKATVRPLAGTRKRGATPEEDLALEKELLADPKEIAEHLMLIDLGRNDIGRIAKTGSVKVTEKMVVERYSHVMHIVSNVQAEVLSEMSNMDVLRATFPAGTLTGTPKVRAMEIIDELEPVKRGIYSGAVGYLAWNGNMDTAIAIRTAVIKDETVYIQAGAGVVADSVPELEWQETLNKGRALFRAVALASKGLDQSGGSENATDD